jgi:hypothetical protein
MVDDGGPVARVLERVIAPLCSLTPVAVHHVRHGPAPAFKHGGGLCSSVLMALQWAQANTDAEFVLKLDTDSLVINPFAEKLSRVFKSDPALGMIGAYTLTPNGTPRLWEHHATTVMRMSWGPFYWCNPLRAIFGSGGSCARAKLIRAALRNGYDPGEHCLGGGYALSRPLLERMARSGYLADPRAWMNVDLAEDVMVGVHVRAVGMTLANYVRPSEVFGVRYQGLPADPDSLVERGFSVIHSVKNDPLIDEASIRAFFKSRREATKQPPAPIRLRPNPLDQPGANVA